jgi:hypothetical protein
MMINLLTKTKIVVIIKEEFKKLSEELWKECDDLRRKVMLLEDEIKILKNG